MGPILEESNNTHLWQFWCISIITRWFWDHRFSFFKLPDVGFLYQRHWWNSYLASCWAVQGETAFDLGYAAVTCLHQKNLNVEVGETFERLTNTVERNWGSWDINQKTFSQQILHVNQLIGGFLYISLHPNQTSQRGPSRFPRLRMVPKVSPCPHATALSLCQPVLVPGMKNR